MSEFTQKSMIQIPQLLGGSSVGSGGVELFDVPIYIMGLDDEVNGPTAHCSLAYGEILAKALSENTIVRGVIYFGNMMLTTTNITGCTEWAKFFAIADGSSSEIIYLIITLTNGGDITVEVKTES